MTQEEKNTAWVLGMILLIFFATVFFILNNPQSWFAQSPAPIVVFVLIALQHAQGLTRD